MLAKPSTTRTDGLPAPADTEAKVDGQTSPTPKEEEEEEEEQRKKKKNKRKLADSGGSR